MRHVRDLQYCLGLLLCSATALAQDAEPKKLGIDELRGLVAKISTKDPDPIPKLMNLCIMGKETGALAHRMDVGDRCLLGWLAMNELALHKVSDKRWMYVLRRIGPMVRASSSIREFSVSDGIGRGDIIRGIARTGVAPPRPDLMDKIWTKARIHKSIDVLHGTDPVLSSHALLDLLIANCLGRFQPAMTRGGTESPEWRFRQGLLRAIRSPDPRLRRRALLLSRALPLHVRIMSAIGEALDRPDDETRPDAMIAASRYTRYHKTTVDWAFRMMSKEILATSGPYLTMTAMTLLTALPYSAGNPHPEEWERILAPVLEHGHREALLMIPPLVQHRFPGTPQAKRVLFACLKLRIDVLHQRAETALDWTPMGPNDHRRIRVLLHDPLGPMRSWGLRTLARAHAG